MPGKKKGRVKLTGPYHPLAIADRIDKLRKERGLTAKECYLSIGLNQWDWSRRINFTAGLAFSIQEISALAELLDAPVGWPWLEPRVQKWVDDNLFRPAATMPPKGESEESP